jgi:hypothetical protein
MLAAREEEEMRGSCSSMSFSLQGYKCECTLVKKEKLENLASRHFVGSNNPVSFLFFIFAL